MQSLFKSRQPLSHAGVMTRYACVTCKTKVKTHSTSLGQYILAFTTHFGEGQRNFFFSLSHLKTGNRKIVFSLSHFKIVGHRKKKQLGYTAMYYYFGVTCYECCFVGHAKKSSHLSYFFASWSI